jgi:hypothetical protein
MRINYIHECIEAGIIKLQYVNTDNEVADVLTKLLPVHYILNSYCTDTRVWHLAVKRLRRMMLEGTNVSYLS